MAVDSHLLWLDGLCECNNLPLNDGQVEKSSFHGRCHFGRRFTVVATLGPRWVEVGHSKVVVSWLL